MNYQRPEKIDEAHKLLASKEAQPLLVHPRMPVEPYAAAETVVDLSRLNLNYLKQEGQVIRIGVMMSLQELADSSVLRSVARGVLAEAASRTAHLGLRNVSTLGGVLLNPASAVEVMLALLVFGVGATHASPVPNEISFSVSSSARAALERVARTPMDDPIVAVCALKDNDVTRVAVGGVGLAPTVVKINDPQSSISPVANFRASVEYQREVVNVLVKRALKRLEK